MMQNVMVLVCLAILAALGYAIISRIGRLYSAALIIAIAATVLTYGSFMYTRKEVEYNGVAAAASMLNSPEVKQICGEKTTNNALCYKEVEYKGYPLKALKTEKLKDGGESTTFVGWRASGLLWDYVFYLAICAALAYGVQYFRPGNKSY